jgi:hypothetical protein
MTMRELGRTGKFVARSEAAVEAAQRAIQICLDNGYPEKYAGYLMVGLFNREVPHLNAIPEGIEAELVAYGDVPFSGRRPVARFEIEVEEGDFTRGQLIEVVEAAGAYKSRGDKGLLRRLRRG